MVIQKGSQKIIKKFSGVTERAGSKSYIEFFNAEDRGVKYLKLGGELWIYFPDADDIMKISGHMTRNGMMGSDISYEDMMETGELEKKYSRRLLEDATVHNSPCYVIELLARVPDVSYEKQILYIDKKKYIPLKIERYARGGRLLKSIEQFDVENSGGRFFCRRIVVEDKRRKNSSTTIEFSEIRFDQPVPAGTFSLHNLKK